MRWGTSLTERRSKRNERNLGRHRTSCTPQASCSQVIHGDILRRCRTARRGVDAPLVASFATAPVIETPTREVASQSHGGAEKNQRAARRQPRTAKSFVATAGGNSAQ